MNKFIAIIFTYLILMLISIGHAFISTRKLKKYFLKEKEKAYIYRDLVHINNSYYKFLVNNKLEKYPLIKSYLESTTTLLEKCGMDLKLNLFIEEGFKFDVKLNKNDLEKFHKFMDELENCPEPIRKTVLKNAKIFQKIIKYEHPKLYKCIKLEAHKELFRILIDILGKILKNTTNGMIKKIYVIFNLNKKICGEKCEKLYSI